MCPCLARVRIVQTEREAGQRAEQPGLRQALPASAATCQPGVPGPLLEAQPFAPGADASALLLRTCCFVLFVSPISEKVSPGVKTFLSFPGNNPAAHPPVPLGTPRRPLPRWAMGCASLAFGVQALCNSVSRAPWDRSGSGASAPTPTHRPFCPAVNHNLWTFSPDNLIHNPPAFCAYLLSISSFWHGRGDMNECIDGAHSTSDGTQSACSHHGGEPRPCYSHCFRSAATDRSRCRGQWSTKTR